jgi:Ni/Co efflux regulator RcnB
MNRLLPALVAAIFTAVSVSAFAADDKAADRAERQTPPTQRAKQKVRQAGDKVEHTAHKAKKKVKQKTAKAKRRMQRTEDRMEQPANPK